MSMAMPELEEQLHEEISTNPDTPWKVILWNDDVNDFCYVIKVLQRVLKKDKETCERMVQEAHQKGKAPVFTGPQEEAQQKATQLGSATLWATLEKE